MKKYKYEDVMNNLEKEYIKEYGKLDEDFPEWAEFNISQIEEEIDFGDKFTCEICNNEYENKRKRECSICSATVCEYCIENGKICDDCAGEDDD